MHKDEGLEQVAQLFKVLGHESRLWLMVELSRTPMTVGTLAERCDMAQPLVSQHLRMLRQAGLVTGIRHGQSVVYQLTDHHVAHVVADALEHVQETHPITEGEHHE